MFGEFAPRMHRIMGKLNGMLYLLHTDIPGLLI